MTRSIALSPFDRQASNYASISDGRTMSINTLTAPQYASRSVTSIHYGNRQREQLALIIPAYNEEKVLAHTIQSAIDAGLSKEHIYIVDDCSNDATTTIARHLVGNHNILRVERSGKGRAIFKLQTGLLLTKRYEWIHIADADGEFDTNYFAKLFENLDPKNAAATGYVASLPGSIISKYRAFEYTLGMDLIRRFQSLAGVITIIPGPTSIFRSDVFEKLDFSPDILCEDFDITLQLHRRRLGTIQFIPEAIARTQDPSNLSDFIKQITRWNRGVMQMIIKHKVGLRPTKVDAYLTYQIFQNLTFFLMYFIWIPYISLVTHNPMYLALSFICDVALTFAFALFATARSGRTDIIPAFPFIYLLRFVALGVFMKCFLDVLILRKFVKTKGMWQTVARRRTA